MILMDEAFQIVSSQPTSSSEGRGSGEAERTHQGRAGPVSTVLYPRRPPEHFQIQTVQLSTDSGLAPVRFRCPGRHTDREGSLQTEMQRQRCRSATSATGGSRTRRMTEFTPPFRAKETPSRLLLQRLNFHINSASAHQAPNTPAGPRATEPARSLSRTQQTVIVSLQVAGRGRLG